MAHMMTRMTHTTRWLAGSQFVKTPSLRPIFNVILILREVFTYYCHLHGPSLPQQINCDKILFFHTRRWYQFLFSFFNHFSFYVMLFLFILFLKIFTKFYYYYFFIIIINQFMKYFFHVPECSKFYWHLTKETRSIFYFMPSRSMPRN